VALQALELIRQANGPLDSIGRNAGVVASVLAWCAGDRDRYCADPDFSDTPVEWLLSKQYAQELADRAMAGGRFDLMPQRKVSGDTVAVVTADTRGNWVSLIQSVFHAFGATILEPTTGIILHNRGASFSLEPRSPNRLAGGKRPLHTLMPVLTARNGILSGALGAMGGRAQPQVHTHMALQLSSSGSAETATSAPRWVLGAMESGVTSNAGVVYAEKNVPDIALQSMRTAGLTVSMLDQCDDGVGHGQIVLRSTSSEILAAATDPRADGIAMAG
jgi:gamma-glutamyltranspeptidase/glutathione hydrolase